MFQATDTAGYTLPVALTVNIDKPAPDLDVKLDRMREMAMRIPHNNIYGVIASGGKTFLDLAGHWAQADVELLASKLIVQGVTGSRCAPQADITRGIHRLARARAWLAGQPGFGVSGVQPML